MGDTRPGMAYNRRIKTAGPVETSPPSALRQKHPKGTLTMGNPFMGFTSLFSNPVFLALMIPIVAILVGGAITIVKLLISHHERMTMIDRGIHPDYPHRDEDTNQT